MIQTTYLGFEIIFRTGFFLGILTLEFILLIFMTYLSTLRIKEYKEFLKRNKLLQKFEEDKDYYNISFWSK